LRRLRKALSWPSGELVTSPPPHLAATGHHAASAVFSQNIL
jgi:hypothetical protein